MLVRSSSLLRGRWRENHLHPRDEPFRRRRVRRADGRHRLPGFHAL